VCKGILGSGDGGGGGNYHETQVVKVEEWKVVV